MSTQNNNRRYHVTLNGQLLQAWRETTQHVLDNIGQTPILAPVFINQLTSHLQALLSHANTIWNLRFRGRDTDDVYAIYRLPFTPAIDAITLITVASELLCQTYYYDEAQRPDFTGQFDNNRYSSLSKFRDEIVNLLFLISNICSAFEKEPRHPSSMEMGVPDEQHNHNWLARLRYAEHLVNLAIEICTLHEQSAGNLLNLTVWAKKRACVYRNVARACNEVARKDEATHHPAIKPSTQFVENLRSLQNFATGPITEVGTRTFTLPDVHSFALKVGTPKESDPMLYITLNGETIGYLSHGCIKAAFRMQKQFQNQVTAQLHNIVIEGTHTIKFARDSEPGDKQVVESYLLIKKIKLGKRK